jgi:glycosyltransferase involved in cell wall biosynthesis
VSASAALIAPATGEIQEPHGGVKTRPLRVLTLTPFYPSAEDPTQGEFISQPLTRMGHLGISHEVIAVQPFYRRLGHSAENGNVTWKNYLSIPGNVGLSLAGNSLAGGAMPTILRKHRETPFDLIHAHAALPCGHAAALISKRLSIPFVVSVHGLDAFFVRQAGAVIGNWCSRVAGRVYRSASAVICISEKVREQVLSAAAASTTVIYNGVDPGKFFPEIEPNSRLMVLCVGNLIAIKGHALLLRAFARMLGHVPDCSLEIIGDGPELGRLAQLAAQLGIAGRVHFRGRQNRSEVAEAMRQCAIFALPSTYEGLGCVYLEAMACAKPAIGCRGQGIEEIIEHGKTGMLVAAGSEGELSNSLRALLLDRPLRLRTGLAARQAVLDRLTVNHQAQQLADVYRRCVR